MGYTLLDIYMRILTCGPDLDNKDAITQLMVKASQLFKESEVMSDEEECGSVKQG